LIIKKLNINSVASRLVVATLGLTLAYMAVTLEQQWVARRAARTAPLVLVQLPAQFSVDAAREATALRMALNRTDVLSASDPVSKLVGTVHPTAEAPSLVAPTKTEQTYAYVGATVKGSFTRTALRAGLPAAEVLHIKTVFGDVLALNQMKAGDSFHALYQVADANSTNKNGTLVAAEIQSNGQTYRAARYVDKKGSAEYYTPEGQSLHPGFMRAPLRYTQVSSGFSHNRLDPVLHTYHSHEAVDLAAPYGTPVKATANGRIRFRGYNGGYGNLVEIDHAQKCLTRYAHLSRYAKNLYVGKQVKQNEVIGYVGSTGYSTGAHVHYEFVMEGVKRNPMTVSLPRTRRLNAKEHVQFAMQSHAWFAQLDTNTSQLNKKKYV